jgi:hypothetical protein
MSSNPAGIRQAELALLVVANVRLNVGGGQEAELLRLEGFVTNRNAAAWRKDRDLRAYIQAVEERAIREHGRIEEGSELDCWLKWARQQADRLDPLTPSPPSILDEAP